MYKQVLVATMLLGVATAHAESDLTISVELQSSPQMVAGVSRGRLRIAIGNNGPDAGQGRVQAQLVGLSAITWSCATMAGSTCGAISGAGSPSTTVNVASGGNAWIVVDFTAASSATGTAVSRATVQAVAPTVDSLAANNSASGAPITFTSQATLAVTIDDGQTTARAGDVLTYRATVTNQGPSDVRDLPVQMATPAGAFSTITWTCASTNASCSPSGTGPVATALKMVAGGQSVFTIRATLAPTSAGTIATTLSVPRRDGSTGDVTAEDRTQVTPAAPPPIDCAPVVPDKRVLRTPDHKMIAVTLGGLAEIVITKIMQDEPVNGQGDGDTSPDASFTGAVAQLRAERSGRGDGRVYQISFRAGDGRGGACTGTTTVCVPKNPKDACVDGGATVDSTRP